MVSREEVTDEGFQYMLKYEKTSVHGGDEFFSRWGDNPHPLLEHQHRYPSI